MPQPSPKRHRFVQVKRRQVLLLQYWWEDRVFRGVADFARKHGWALNCEMRWTGRLPKIAWSGDGIIAYVGVADPQKHFIEYIQGTGVPVVETQPPQIPGSGAVYVSYERIGEMAADHLLSLQFQHIGYVTLGNNASEAGRRAGVMRKVVASGGSFHALKYAKLPSQLPLLPKPLGLVALNDINAQHLVLTCLAQGFAVPEEVAVIGADDTEVFCDLAAVPLTSVQCNRERQGYEAAALLHGMMDGKAPPKQPLVISPRGVAVRRSTDTIAFPNPQSARLLRFLRDHFREPLNLAETAQKLGITMRRVQTDFRQHLGRSVIQELVRLRIEYARKLLEDTDLKVESVGLESGFGDRPHFIKTFARATRQTPKQFRAASRAERASAERFCPSGSSSLRTPQGVHE